MKKKLLTIAAFVLAGFSAQSFAGYVDSLKIQNVHVVKVETFSVSGTEAIRIFYETDQDSVMPDANDLNCSPNTTPVPGTTNVYYASYWNSSVNGFLQVQLSSVLFAKAQNLPIDIMFDMGSGCKGDVAKWGYYGLGKNINGVLVH